MSNQTLFKKVALNLNSNKFLIPIRVNPEDIERICMKSSILLNEDFKDSKNEKLFNPIFNHLNRFHDNDNSHDEGAEYFMSNVITIVYFVTLLLTHRLFEKLDKKGNLFSEDMDELHILIVQKVFSRFLTRTDWEEDKDLGLFIEDEFTNLLQKAFHSFGHVIEVILRDYEFEEDKKENNKDKGSFEIYFEQVSTLS